MYKISIIVCVVLMMIFVGVVILENYKGEKQEGKIAGEKPLGEPVAKLKSQPVKIIFEDEGDSIIVANPPTQEDSPTLDGETNVLRELEDDAKIRIAEEDEEGIKLGDLTIAETVEWGLIDWDIAQITPTTGIIIDGEGGEEICALDWSTGKLEFRGKMSSSARSFFKYFLKPYVDEYIAGELDKKDEAFILPKKGADNEGEILVISDSNEIIAIWHDIWKLAYTWQGLDAGTDSSFWMHEEVYQRTTIAGEFIQWLYLNDYKIVKEDK